MLKWPDGLSCRGSSPLYRTPDYLNGYMYACHYLLLLIVGKCLDTMAVK